MLIGDAAVVTPGAFGFKAVVLPLGLEGKGGDHVAMAKASIGAAKEGKYWCEQCQAFI